MVCLGWLSASKTYLSSYNFSSWITTAAKLDNKGSKGNITFTRRYLDPNRVTYEVQHFCVMKVSPLIRTQYHTGTTGHNFDTQKGISITRGLQNLATEFNLTFKFGTAPHDFYLNR